MDCAEFDLQVVRWNQIKQDVYRVNQTLAELCDRVAANKDYHLYKIRYPYGALIVDNGTFYLPTKRPGFPISINDQDVTPSIRAALKYSQIPLCLVLDKSAEVFTETEIENQVVPLNFFKAGDMFGLFETADMLTNLDATKPTWNVSSGARSVFMLPGIGKNAHNLKLSKAFNTKVDNPKTLFDHWKNFVPLHNTVQSNSKWHSTILVFTNEWFDQNNNLYSNFRSYLIGLAWVQAHLAPRGNSSDLLGLHFTNAVNLKGMKPRPYLLDTVKYLMSIARGFGIAFIPASDDSALPKKFLQDAYVQHYELNDYMPTLMHPGLLTDGGSVYYSLSVPTVSNSSALMRNAPNIIEDQRTVKSLLEILTNFMARHADYSNIARNAKFDFFHIDQDRHCGIGAVSEMTEGDQRFSDKRFADRALCHSSKFFVGCIRISTVPHESEVKQC